MEVTCECEYCPRSEIVEEERREERTDQMLTVKFQDCEWAGGHLRAILRMLLVTSHM